VKLSQMTSGLRRWRDNQCRNISCTNSVRRSTTRQHTCAMWRRSAMSGRVHSLD